MFHYTGCGLKNVWLRNGYIVRNTSYGEGVAIYNLEELHTLIGLHIINHKPCLSGEEIRFLRKELDLPQADLAFLLGVSESSLRGWENDRAKITKAPDRLLRMIYREHAEGNIMVRSFIEKLSSLNLEDYFKHRIELEKTEQGWREAA